MMVFLNETSYLESIYLAFIIVALAISVFHIRKDTDSKKNLQCFILAFVVTMLVFLIVWLMKNVVFKYTNIPDDPTLNFWVVIAIPLIFLIAYIFFCCNVKMMFRNITASLCIIVVIIISIYPSLMAYKDYKKYEYVLDGS
jgi:phosphoglycerol transferase MdoB-like AlkP superfamily enzyme